MWRGGGPVDHVARRCTSRTDWSWLTAEDRARAGSRGSSQTRAVSWTLPVACAGAFTASRPGDKTPSAGPIISKSCGPF
jgi:hypothetical protein